MASSYPDPIAEAQASVDSGYITAEADVRRALTIIRDLRASVEIRFDGDSTLFHAKILDVWEGVFLLEDIQPRNGMAQLNAGTPFALVGRSRGLYMFIDRAQVVKSESERGVPYFHVPLPDHLLFQQQRRTRRFQLPLRVGTEGAHVILHRKTPVSGQVIDISAGGCRALFDGPVKPPLEIDEPVAHCELAIRDLLKISAEAIVRHAHFDKKKGAVFCGIEFNAMSVTDRRRLEQFIQTIARAPAVNRATRHES